MDFFPPLSPLSDGDIVSIRFNTGNPTSTTKVTVNFSRDPSASFGSTTGESVSGTAQDGSILINASPPGDLNGDGYVSVEDIQLVAGYWRTSTRDPNDYEARYDLDGNGHIDIVDIAIVASRLN